jgi:hypothetical protein
MERMRNKKISVSVTHTVFVLALLRAWASQNSSFVTGQIVTEVRHAPKVWAARM